MPTFIVVVFWLYLYTDLPDWSSSSDSESTTVFSFFSSPFDLIFNRALFPSQQETTSHLKIAGYWLTILAVVIPLIQSTSGSWSQVDLRRKVWHITIVLMFLPVGLPSHPTFTKLCMAGATFIFLAIEFIRVTTIPPLGRAIHTSLLKYLDPRDTCGPIIVSHIFCWSELAYQCTCAIRRPELSVWAWEMQLLLSWATSMVELNGVGPMETRKLLKAPFHL